jgi:hypothetical protein
MNSRLVATECGQKGKSRGKKSNVGVTQRDGSLLWNVQVVPVQGVQACGEVKSMN